MKNTSKIFSRAKVHYHVCSGCGMIDCCDSWIDATAMSNALMIKRGSITRYIKYITKNEYSFDFDQMIQFIKDDTTSKNWLNT